MIRFCSLDGVSFVVTTKNGLEQRFLQKFATVFESQINPEARAALALFIKKAGWSLTGELVVRDLGEHGSIPLSDHFVIHGGTKLDGSPITPLDLIQMKHTIDCCCRKLVQGIWFPLCVVLQPMAGKDFIDGDAIDTGLAAVNGLQFWGKEDSLEARIKLFRSVLKSRDVASVAYCNYDVEKLDGTQIWEGWVAWQVTDLKLWPMLVECLNAEGKFGFKLIGRSDIDCAPAGFGPSAKSAKSKVGASAKSATTKPPRKFVCRCMGCHDYDNSGPEFALTIGAMWTGGAQQGGVMAPAQTQQAAALLRSPTELHPEAAVAPLELHQDVTVAPADVQLEVALAPLELQQAATAVITPKKREEVPSSPPLTTFPQNFAAPERYTIQEALRLIAAPTLAGPGDTVLRPLLCDLVRFSESRFGQDISKFNSFIISISTNPDGVRILSITVRSDDIWAAYARYREFDDVGCGRAMPLSRGMSFVLTEDHTLAMSPPDEYPLLQEQRTKLKLANYVLRTMLLRPWISEQKQRLARGEAVDVDSLFQNALGQMRRWRVVVPERRLEVLTLVRNLAAFMAAFGGRKQQSIFDVQNASYIEILDVMVPRAVALVMDEGLRAQMAAGGMQDQMLHRLTSWSEDLSILNPCTVAALQELMPYTCFALLITCKQLWARNVEYGFSVQGAQQVEGLARGAFFRELQNAKLAEEVKTELLPLASLATKYGTSSFVNVHSQSLRPLTLVLIAAVPGTGKSACVDRLAELLGSDRTVVLSSDQAGRGVSLSDLLESKPLDYSVEFVVVDRCSASNVDTVRKTLWNSLLCYDLHVRLIVPTSFEQMSMDGNDWHLPFSMEELATYLGSVLARTQHVGKVDGPKGFLIAASHVVSTARYYGSVEEEARESWGPLVASFGCGYYQPLKDVAPEVPAALRVAVLLALGLELSKTMRKLASKFPPKPPATAAEAQDPVPPAAVAPSAKKGGAKKAPLSTTVPIVSDAVMLRKIATGFARMYDNYTYDMEELLVGEPDDAKFLANWEQWLAVKVAPIAAEYHLRARRSVEDVALQMLDAVMTPSQAERHMSMELLSIPVVPNTFAIMYNQSTVRFITEECSQKIGIFPSRNLHTTLHVTDFFSNLEGLEYQIERAVGGLDENDIEFESMGMSSESVVIHVEGGMHITIMCAGANKDSCAGTRRILGIDHAADGRVVACVPL